MTGPTQNSLRVEGIVVFSTTIGVLGLVRYMGLAVWWTTPAILTIAGLLPFIARRQRPPAILHTETLGRDLCLALFTSLAILPMTYWAMGLIHRAGMSLPWIPAKPSSYAAWVIYQFLYVAAPEEFFFRGYLLANLHFVFNGSQHSETKNQNDLLRTQNSELRTPDWMAIAASSGCFALAHVVIYGYSSGALTFLPGLILGWLYLRTGSLLSPILFHGLANVCWQFAVRG